MSRYTLCGLLLVLLDLPVTLAQETQELEPTQLEALVYTQEYFPKAHYDEKMPTQASLVGFAAGTRATNSREIEQCLRAWTERSDRAHLVEYARSHENRPLHYVVVSSPQNLARVEAIQSGMERLSDPRGLTDAESDQLIADLPAVAWLAYTIHGDETEGSDAALAVLYHLLASTDDAVEKMLSELVIIIDPLMNPDGRDRCLKMVTEHRGRMPDVDDRTLLHTGYWPRGRGNHYLFDLNRDWILGVHPETRGRIREVAKWHPLLFVDAHGMGSQATHLFSPPRAPFNPNRPKSRTHWGNVFARDQAAAFDRQGWVYYHGEWNEEWYPGYSDSWASYRGAVGILYEQASITEDGVRRPEGRVLSYRESVHHHVVGTMANLETLRTHAKDRLRDFLAERRRAVSPDGRYANRTFAILPSSNQSRLEGFIELMRLQGFEIHFAELPFTAPLATDQLGRETKDVTIPAGTILISNRQPLAHLVAAMLEFDSQIPDDALRKEREELLRTGGSRIYDTTAWNMTMMHGLEALTLPIQLPASAKHYQPDLNRPKGLVNQVPSPVAYVIDGANDLSVTAAARLMERGIEVRVAQKEFELAGNKFARGSVVVTNLDNRRRADELPGALDEIGQLLGLVVTGLGTGLGEGELPDLGGRYFTRLEPPRIALVGRGGISSYDYGSVWHLLDHRLSIRHSRVSEESRPDLGRYNILVVPDRWSQSLSESLRGAIKDWVETGGTLIAIGNSAAAFASEEAELSQTRVLSKVLDRLADYELTIFREWLSRQGRLPEHDVVWSHKAPSEVHYPWQSKDDSRPDEEELKKRDSWQRIFMPQGAILAARVDEKHWLTFGSGETMPVLIGRQPVLMAASDVEAPIRLGVWTRWSDTDSKRDNSDGDNGTAPVSKRNKETRRVGWATLPAGYDLHLRMSGLLWPEATHRLANAAYVTRESVGRGQVILFAAPPSFRGSTLGTMRILTNALVYGPGCGTRPTIKP